MMFKKLTTVWGLALVLALGVSGAASAQSTNGKVGIIDVERLVAESAKGKAKIAELEAFGKQKQTEGEAQEATLKALRQRIADGQNSLSAEKLAELQKEYEEGVINIQRFSEDTNKELQRRQSTILGELEKEVLPVINEIGAELGFQLIFQKFSSGLVYADPTTDITDQVIERFNRRTSGS